MAEISLAGHRRIFSKRGAAEHDELGDRIVTNAALPVASRVGRALRTSSDRGQSLAWDVTDASSRRPRSLSVSARNAKMRVPPQRVRQCGRVAHASNTIAHVANRVFDRLLVSYAHPSAPQCHQVRAHHSQVIRFLMSPRRRPRS